ENSPLNLRPGFSRLPIGWRWERYRSRTHRNPRQPRRARHGPCRSRGRKPCLWAGRDGWRENPRGRERARPSPTACRWFDSVAPRYSSLKLSLASDFTVDQADDAWGTGGDLFVVSGNDQGSLLFLPQ